MIIERKIILLLFFFAFFRPLSFGQIIDITKIDPYQKVFVETNNFGFSYLEELEASLSKIQADSLKFEVLHDLAYYWQTRNLNTALKFTENGLKLTSKEDNFLWNGRFQATQAAILLRQE